MYRKNFRIGKLTDLHINGNFLKIWTVAVNISSFVWLGPKLVAFSIKLDDWLHVILTKSISQTKKNEFESHSLFNIFGLEPRVTKLNLLNKNSITWSKQPERWQKKKNNGISTTLSFSELLVIGLVSLSFIFQKIACLI